MGENITHNKELNRFEYITPEATAYIEYEISEKVMDLSHTIVPELLEGRGLGGALVKHALDYARSNGFRIIPTCWFVDKFVKKFKDYQDLVIEISEDSHNGPVCEI